MNAINPWGNKAPEAPAQFVTATGESLPGNLQLQGSQPGINAQGEINASNVVDALGQIDKLMKMAASGQVQRKNTKITREESEQRRQILHSAYMDASGKQWEMLGASIAEEIRGQADREGFMRRVLVGNPLDQGQVPRVPVRDNNAVAVVATSSATVEYQQLRSKVLTPAEFSLIANLYVENIDIQQVSGDILERTYNEGVEAIMTGEDRLWKMGADATAGIENNVVYIGSSLTPSILAQVRSGVTNWNIPATTMLLANDLWNDIIGNSDFHSLMDPVHRYDLVLNGQIGSMLGMELITDAFRSPSQKVLEQGELYAVGAPEHHGSYTDRGGVVPTPVDGAGNGNATKGWFLQELMSLVIANPRSVSIGRRL